MLAQNDLLGESLKDLCAAHARLFQDLALVARDGERNFLERVQEEAAKAEFQQQRADQTEAEVVELLQASYELECEAVQHHSEMLELRRQLYSAQHHLAQSEHGKQDHLHPNHPTVTLGGASCTPKKLSLRSFLDIVEQIYTSKARADMKAHSTGIAHETLEQHMYTTLRER